MIDRMLKKGSIAIRILSMVYSFDVGVLTYWRIELYQMKFQH